MRGNKVMISWPLEEIAVTYMGKCRKCGATMRENSMVSYLLILSCTECDWMCAYNSKRMRELEDGNLQEC